MWELLFHFREKPRLSGEIKAAHRMTCLRFEAHCGYFNHLRPLRDITLHQHSLHMYIWSFPICFPHYHSSLVARTPLGLAQHKLLQLTRLQNVEWQSVLFWLKSERCAHRQHRHLHSRICCSCKQNTPSTSYTSGLNTQAIRRGPVSHVGSTTMVPLSVYLAGIGVKTRPATMLMC